jgi:hypothetical protein
MWSVFGGVHKIARMPKTKDIVNTSLRLPRKLHAELDAAAERAGITLRAEMIFRLQHDPNKSHAEAILAEIRARDTAVEQQLRKQVDALWGALDRAGDVLERVQKAMSLADPEGKAGALKRDVEFARQLIDALSAHR